MPIQHPNMPSGHSPRQLESSISAQSNASTKDVSRPDSRAIDTEPTEEEIQRKPWKHIGYKGYANFIASEDDLFILRRFDTLNTRVALALQDEISELEEELGMLDKRYSSRDAEDVHNGTFREDLGDRSEMIKTIAK